MVAQLVCCPNCDAPGGPGGGGGEPTCICALFDDDSLPPGVAPCSLWGTFTNVGDDECEDCEDRFNGNTFEFTQGNCAQNVGGALTGRCQNVLPSNLAQCLWFHEFDPPFCTTDCLEGGGNVTIKCMEIAIYQDPDPPWNHDPDEYSVFWQIFGYVADQGIQDFECCWIASASEEVTATGQNNLLNWSDLDGLVFDEWSTTVGLSGPSVCAFGIPTTATLALSP